MRPSAATTDVVVRSPAEPLLPLSPPPKVDTTIASVPLKDVVFDTFQGGYVPLSEATDSLIEVLRDAINPIYEPRYDGVEGGAWLGDDDLVLGYDSDSGGYAYPIKILNLHEIVNDVIDGVPVLVSYCPLCASGIVYSRELDGEVLLFGNTSALYQSDMIMYDHQTGSYWFQVPGEAIVGPLTGKRLTLLPSVTILWSDWKALHPDTKVLSKDLGLIDARFGNPYNRDPFVGYDTRLNRGQFPFPIDEDRLDDRLLSGDLVFAVEVGGHHKAYLLAKQDDRVVNDRIAGQRIVVISRSSGPSSSAYFSEVDGEVLTFQLAGGTVEDTVTGSRWDDSGRAFDGPLAGARLTPVGSRTSFWFVLAASHPGIELYAP